MANVGPVVSGGQMNPVATEQAARSRQFAEQRANLAFQQQAETGRTNIQESGATTRTAMQTGSNERIAGMQESGANTRAAMQAGVEDRASARRLISDKENRDFLSAQQKDDQEFKAKAANAERLWYDAKESREVGRAEAAQEWYTNLKKDEITYNERVVLTNTIASMGMLKYMMNNETSRTKAQLSLENMAADAQKMQEVVTKRKESFKQTWKANEQQNIEDLADTTIKSLGTSVTSVDQLSLANYSSLEKKISDGEIGKGELMNLMVYIDSLKENISGISGVAGKNLSEGQKNYRTRIFNKMDEADRVLTKLKVSENPQVKSIASEAWRAVNGMTSGDYINKANEMIGGTMDFDALMESIKEIYNIPDANYTSVMGDTYRSADKTRANIMKNKLTGGMK
jgi:hypothetical protein